MEVASLPHSLFAETAVLGSILLEPETLHTISQIIREDDFYKDSHRRIFRALIAMYEKSETIDMVTLRQHLLDEGILEDIGGLPTLLELENSVPSAANSRHYAAIVKDKASKRELIRLSERMAEAARNEDREADELIVDAESDIFNLGQKFEPKGLVPIEKPVGDAYDLIGKAEKGIPTFVELDRLLTGLKRSDLIIVAARPGMGKTSFCINLAERAATRQGKSVAFFSLEMANIQLASRMLFAKAGVDQGNAHKEKIADEDWTKLSQSLDAIANAKIFLDDTPGITVAEVRGKCRRLQREQGLDLLIIDYIQLMQSSNSTRQENRQQQISEISRQLKGLAKELNVPVIAISQLSRAAVARTEGKPKMPDLSHLRESGALEQDADIVIFIHRPCYYDRENENELLAIVRVAKHRNGPVGEAKLGFIENCANFVDMDFEHTEDGFAPPEKGAAGD